jgi:Arc/MetJ family transcription regulator
MATYLSLDPELLEKTMRLSGEKTKKGAVNRALKEFVSSHEQQEVIKFFGKLKWDESYNYKNERSQRCD